MIAGAVQWAPTGNPLEGIPSEVTALLAEGDRTWGYGYGPGWAMVFGSATGDVTVEPGQWVIRYQDGTIEVTDHAYRTRAVADSRKRDEWLTARMPMIGGSDAANYAKRESAPSYLRAKLHHPFNGTAFTRHGNDREPHMLAAYGFEQNTILYHAPAGDRLHLRHGATPDGIRVRPDGRLVTAQCKTFNHPIKHIEPKYRRQMWWEMYALDADRGLFIWEEHRNFRPISFEPESFWLDRDDTQIRDLIEIADIVLDGMDDAADPTRNMENR